MKYYIQTTAFATLLLLSACGDDSQLQGNLPEGIDPDAPIEFPATKSTASGDREEETTFQDGTEIGIYMDGYETYENKRFVYSNGKFSPATADDCIYYGEAGAGANYTAYYPYNGQGDYDDPAIEQDQSTAKSYYLSDALMATGTLGQPLTFKHRMAKVVIRIDRDVTAVSLEDQGIKLFNDGDKRTWRGILQPGTQNLKAVITQGSTNYEVDYGEVTLTAGRQREFTVRGWMGADGYIVLDLSKEPITIDKEGKYRIIQSEGGTTSNNITVNIPTGTTANVQLQGVSISAGTAFRVDHGTAKIVLTDDKTYLTSTEAGQPGISLTNADAHVHILGNNHTLTIIGGPDGDYDSYLPAGPAIGVCCDKTGGNITIEHCVFYGTAREHAAVIGTCGDRSPISEDWGKRYSICGNITITGGVMNLTGVQEYWSRLGTEYSDLIGNGHSGRGHNWFYQYCYCGDITLTEVMLKPTDMNVGSKDKYYPPENYRVGTVTIDGVVQN